MAEALFVKTSRVRVRPAEVDFLRRAERFTVRANGQAVAAYRWGTGPAVLCTHGWWSHAGRFAVLGDALVAAGHSVIAFDAPGHGRSAGWRATMPEFARALEAVAAHAGGVDAVVGHSLGGAATVYALSRGLAARRAVVLAAPTDLQSWADRFRDAFRLPPAVYARMQENLIRRIGVGWEDLIIPTLASRVTVPGLVVHCDDDPDVAIAEGEALTAAWPAATLYRTSDLGHRAILRDPVVVARVVEFVGEG
jgi:pimeloyl-ACP methyl ester carboxylesterase